MNPEDRDDLYDELVDDFRHAGLLNYDTAWKLADRAEEHADRRVAKVLRIMAKLDKQLDRQFLEEAADRFDPDVATDEEN